MMSSATPLSEVGNTWRGYHMRLRKFSGAFFATVLAAIFSGGGTSAYAQQSAPSACHPSVKITLDKIFADFGSDVVRSEAAVSCEQNAGITSIFISNSVSNGISGNTASKACDSQTLFCKPENVAIENPPGQQQLCGYVFGRYAWENSENGSRGSVTFEAEPDCQLG